MRRCFLLRDAKAKLAEPTEVQKLGPPNPWVLQVNECNFDENDKQMRRIIDQFRKVNQNQCLEI